MLSVSRFRGVVVVVFAVLLAMVCVDLTLTLAVGSASQWLINGEQPADPKVLKVTGEILSGLVGLPEPVGIGTKSPLGIVLGQSTAGAAIDAAVVEKNDGVSIRWLNLHGWGGSVNHIHAAMELLFLSRIKPNVVVFAINPHMLIGHDFAVGNVPKGGSRIVQLIKPWFWTYYNRILVNYFFQLSMYDVRCAVLRTFGLRFTAFAPPQPNPWIRIGGAGVDDKSVPSGKALEEFEAMIKARVEFNEKEGWFDPAQYSPESPNSRALVDLIRRFREGGAKVYIVLMPEHTALRTRIPIEGVRCFDKINQTYFPDDPVPVYDEMRDGVPDLGFRDTDHVRSIQTERSSALFARLLRKALAEQFPVDKREVEASDSKRD